MTETTMVPMGPFSLAESVRFLEGFTPAGYRGGGPGEPLRLAFPLEGSWETTGVAVRQDKDGDLHAEFSVPPEDLRQATGQLYRILSLDVDGGGFPAVGAADPVVARLQARYPGLRPVCFHSPYEAAAWAVIGHRIRIAQAARIKQRICDHYGERVVVNGADLSAFPAPEVVLRLAHVPGLTQVKVDRLHAIAQAALDRRLDAGHLRALPATDALAELRALPGIGPFSAELIYVRGAGAPRPFPRPRTPPARLHGRDVRLRPRQCDAAQKDRRSMGAVPELGRRPDPSR